MARAGTATGEGARGRAACAHAFIIASPAMSHSTCRIDR